ncbi:MAG: hypothetical protein A2Y25_03855 [Candidatus Melainabacteria bacterium GWF2_37_15]|nr:MAG: hypothetical protein A2Y25_03855 [Candidatus Melainabacteria bacterium GWF2_37_15]
MELLPEIILTIFILIIAILSFTLKKEQQNVIVWVSFLGVILAMVATGFVTTGEVFSGAFVSNNFISMFRIIILLGTIVTIFLSKDYIRSTGEFYFLLLTATLGAMLLCGANDLIMLFIALETLSISSFALTGYTKFNRLSNEAALKYLIFGAAASGIMLYGFSFIYGLTGHTNLNLIGYFLNNSDLNLIVVVAFLFVLAGFGFKISAVPFHSWAPDVYEGAPLPVAAYLSVVSKTAGFAALIRFISMLFPDTVLVSMIISVFAAITMTVGNIAALRQQNIRRLMAYSSIAHAGYLLMGLAILSYDGVTAVMFYLITYLFMNFGVWAAVEIFATITGKENVDDYNGLSYKHRYYALGLTLCLLSLAGIPITAGFFSKFYLFTVVTMAGYEYIPLLVIGLINTVIALFYYVRVIKAMYVQPEDKTQYIEITKSPLALRAILAVTVAGVILIGVFASPFIEFIIRNTY